MIDIAKLENRRAGTAENGILRMRGLSFLSLANGPTT